MMFPWEVFVTPAPQEERVTTDRRPDHAAQVVEVRPLPSGCVLYVLRSQAAWRAGARRSRCLPEDE